MDGKYQSHNNAIILQTNLVFPTFLSWRSPRQLRDHLHPHHSLTLPAVQLSEVFRLPHFLSPLHLQHLHLPLSLLQLLLQGNHLFPGLVQLLFQIVVCPSVVTSLSKSLLRLLPLPLSLLKSPHSLFLPLHLLPDLLPCLSSNCLAVSKTILQQPPLLLQLCHPPSQALHLLALAPSQLLLLPQLPLSNLKSL